VRFSTRIQQEPFFQKASKKEREGIVIYGAGAAGAELVREIRSNSRVRYDVKGFLDDDPMKHGSLIMGVPVLGSGRQAPSVLRWLNHHEAAVEEILIAMPSATASQMREATSNCRAARIRCKRVPSTEELLGRSTLGARIPNVPMHDLLGRQPVKLDYASIQASIAGRCVLVTGAAGSIGSELCRQLARLSPACLVVFDQAESELFRIENELRERYPELELVIALGDIRDEQRLAEVLEEHGVESVFHAAAYKHVPMMEAHILEAVRNNVLGTWNLVRTACRHNVRSLLMISSDKAVNPVCVMGATKRICERIVSARRDDRASTKRCSVRFGNVLGSSGSVVPIFQAQIAAGGPVRVTHPEARRYFMTISEAASLVLLASTKSEDSEIFVLDMGEPVRIVDLAENMIRLAGMVPYEDIDIHFTGLRPGEKLIEEINDKSGTMTRYQEKIQIIREKPLSWEAIKGWIDELQFLLTSRRPGELIKHIARLVPEYTPGLNHAADASAKLAARAPQRSILPMRSSKWHDAENASKNGRPRNAVPSEELVPPVA
jgi:FlaA1/EpsC-like NDP-sugar epimerase